MPCPKCGSADISRTYREVDEQWAEASRKRRKPSDHLGQTNLPHVFKALKEHIGHHCRCCQHDWETPPLSEPLKPPAF